MARETTVWEIINEATKYEQAKLKKFPEISYDLNTNTIIFLNENIRYSPAELIEIAEHGKSVRSKILSLLETGQIHLKDFN